MAIRRYLLRKFDRLAARAAKSVLKSSSDESYDMTTIAALKAAYESVVYQEANFPAKPAFKSDLDLLSHAMSLVSIDGLRLEFGVASGRTIRHIASQSPEAVYGFDSFEGLPETWRTGFPEGMFAGGLPAVPSNAHLIKGWFSETLPGFLELNPAPAAFIHIDCDLYSSTKFILEKLADRIVVGTVIVFDEYFNYPGWQMYEFKAFQEFVGEYSRKYEYLGFVPTHQQVAVIIR